MSAQDRNAVLSGTPLKYSEVSPRMQQAFKNSLDAALALQAAKSGDTGVAVERPDTSDLSGATLSLTDKTKPGTGVRQLWISLDLSGGSYTFRWNDYDAQKNQPTYARPASFTQEPEANGKFSRAQMRQQAKKLTELRITVPEGERTLAKLLKYIAENYHINFITHEDKIKEAIRFSCDDLPLGNALDTISKEYGDWEWEASPGDFIVLRSKESPRRRVPLPKAVSN